MRQASICMLLLLTVSVAHAGYRYRITTESADGKPVESMVLTTQDGHLAMDVHEKAAKKPVSSVLWSGDAVTMVQHPKRRYTRMDEKAADAIAEQAGGAMKQLDQAMAGMSQAQKDAIEKMMKQRGGMPKMDPEKMKGLAVQPPPGLAELALEATGKPGSHNGIDCLWFEARRGAELSGRMCLAEAGAFPGAAELSASFRDMSRFMIELTEKITESMGMAGGMGGMGGPGGLGQMSQSVQALSFEQGFPVIAETYEGGRLTEKSVLESAEEVSGITATAFQPPSDYEAETLGPRSARR